MMVDLNANTSDQAAAQIQSDTTLRDYLALSTSVANTLQLNQEYQERMETNTNTLAIMNESYNANRYIKGTIGTESDRINKLDSQAKRDIYKLRHEQMYYTNKAAYYAFGTRVIIFTLYVTLLAFIPAAMWRAGKVSSIVVATSVGVLMLIYLLVLVLAFAVTARRRKGDWNQFYWKSGNSVSSAAASSGSCS